MKKSWVLLFASLCNIAFAESLGDDDLCRNNIQRLEDLLKIQGAQGMSTGTRGRAERLLNDAQQYLAAGDIKRCISASSQGLSEMRDSLH